ncbi:uncharacterized protein F5891DRAFT_979326 [Suillus fuscotomentosus]|uniref:DUF6532 domain-containing protein n=1 Tax=Suillus fuscotomentosus TaxID=1912939 RepID=A0AAD4HKY3_9AGAM|nr:uncharacterized protein F5891DRAFT_979326 [Suillus fuscotomentosus]KAG1901485.1 hypothetical protein F5891DRAFT_979326 [Suillus fuscotomentosus]
MESPPITARIQQYADNMSSRQRTERDTTQRLHPYRDFRSIMIPNVPHISLNPLMSLEDLESAVCQSDTTSTRHAEPPKLSDYSPEEIEVINSVRRRVIMDMITINGWKKNSTRKQKLAMHSYAREVVNEVKASLDCHGLNTTSSVTTLVIHGLTNSHSKLIENAEKESLPYYIDDLEPEDKTLSAEDRQKYMVARRKAIYNSDDHHTYFLHGHKSGQLSMFSHPALQDVHLKQWYTDESSPLFDDTLRPILTTTTIPMLSMSAVGVMGAIDRYVEGRLSKSGDVLRFTGKLYADKQNWIQRQMKATLQTEVHWEVMTNFFQYLHNKGMKILNERLGLTSPASISVPMSLEELALPHEPENPTTPHDTAPDSYSQFCQHDQQTNSFSAWPSTVSYSGSSVPSGSALVHYSEVQPFYDQSALQMPMSESFAQESYVNFSEKSTCGSLAEEDDEDTFWTAPVSYHDTM